MIFVNSILFLHHSFIVPAICKLEFGRFSFWIWPQNYFQFQKLKVSSLWSKEILVFFSRKGREKRDEVDVFIFVFEMDLLSFDSRFVTKMRVREVDSVMWIHERFVVLSWKFQIEKIQKIDVMRSYGACVQILKPPNFVSSSIFVKF